MTPPYGDANAKSIIQYMTVFMKFKKYMQIEEEFQKLEESNEQ